MSAPAATLADAQRAVQIVCDAWPHALIDLEAIGFASPNVSDFHRSQPGAYADRTAQAAITGSPAVAWIAEFHDVMRPLAGNLTSQTIAHIQRTAAHTATWVVARWNDDDRYLIRRLYRLANTAETWWPKPPTKGATINGTTVGARGNNTEPCALCGDPVAGGATDPIRRIDGQPFHAKTCYYQIWRQRHQAA